MARLILRSSITRLSRCAGIRSAIRAGRRCKVALCPRWTPASRLGHGPDLEEGVVSVQFLVFGFCFLFRRLEACGCGARVLISASITMPGKQLNRGE